jgi:nucleoside 2-deoxyribosyltransferase
MWTILDFPGILVVSTWHDNDTLVEAEEDKDPLACRAAWNRDFRQIRSADHLLVYAEHKDRPNGTLVEIGYALSHEMPVHLVGNFEWGTWRYCELVFTHNTIREATSFIATGKYPTNDPS